MRKDAKAHFAEAANLWREDYLATCFVLCHCDSQDPDKPSWARLVIERAERIAASQPENPAPLSRGAVAFAHLGEAEKAVSWITRAFTIDPDDLITPYNAAVVFTLLGDSDQALRILENYLPKVSDDMIDIINSDKLFEGLRSHSRYDELFKSFGKKPMGPAR